MDDESARLTRRDLLRGVGGAALVVGCATEVDPSRPATRDPADTARFPANQPVPLAFELDGRTITVEVPAHTTLLSLLRIDLGATAAKEICDRGACGGCMVLVDELAMNACMLLAHDVAGKRVTTAAGVGGGAGLSDLQRAFVEHDALQCGFCTPGMIVSATALLRSGAALGRDEVVRGLAGNLCRCGSYPHIVDAVLDVHGRAAARGDDDA